MAALVTVIAVAALVGCAPSAPPAGYASGCGRAAAPVYLQQRLLRSGGVVRTFLLTIPVGYDPNVPTPLVLNFHGSGSSAAEQSAYSQLDAKGMQRGFIVATPDGIDHEWLVGDEAADLAFARGPGPLPRLDPVREPDGSVQRRAVPRWPDRPASWPASRTSASGPSPG